eukprot:m.593205 g.593205  ORF g.593205 m.593205 type:complete len:316 (-) comp22392_c0_seq4:1744-2691(-)
MNTSITESGSLSVGSCPKKMFPVKHACSTKSQLQQKLHVVPFNKFIAVTTILNNPLHANHYHICARAISVAVLESRTGSCNALLSHRLLPGPSNLSAFISFVHAVANTSKNTRLSAANSSPAAASSGSNRIHMSVFSMNSESFPRALYCFCPDAATVNTSHDSVNNPLKYALSMDVGSVVQLPWKPDVSTCMPPSECPPPIRATISRSDSPEILKDSRRSTFESSKAPETPMGSKKAAPTPVVASVRPPQNGSDGAPESSSAFVPASTMRSAHERPSAYRLLIGSNTANATSSPALTGQSTSGEKRTLAPLQPPR